MFNCIELYFTIFVILMTEWLQAIIIGWIIAIMMHSVAFQKGSIEYCRLCLFDQSDAECE